MDTLKLLAERIQGDVASDDETREFYSHDASLFELVPEVVAFPKSGEDIASIVRFVIENKKKHPELSITARSRGTDMSGAAIGQSIVMDTSKYMTRVWT